MLILLLIKWRMPILVFREITFGKKSYAFKFIKRLELYLKMAYPFKSVRLEQCIENSILSLAPSCIYTSIGPNDLMDSTVKRDVSVPPLSLYLFQNALVNSHSSCIVYGGRVVVESFNRNEKHNQGFIEWYNRKNDLISKNKVIELEEGFFLGGNGCWNWYHWVIEILPKVLFLDKVPAKTLLVSRILLKYPSMLDTLKGVLGEEVQLIYLDQTINYRVKKLFYMSSISYVPFNLLSRNVWKVEDVFMRKDILRSMRDKLVAHFINRSTVDSIDKIFIYRTTHRIAGNQDSLLSEMQKEGFVSLNFENMSIVDQIHYMQNTSVVMGISGAAFTNLIFARPGTTFICFMQRGLEGFSCFSNLAAIFGINLVYHFYETTAKPSEHYASGFDLNIKKIKDLYKQVTHEKALPHSIS